MPAKLIQQFRNVPAWLFGPDGNRLPKRSANRIVLGSWLQTPTSFKLDIHRSTHMQIAADKRAPREVGSP
jgi:hypothetical protein